MKYFLPLLILSSFTLIASAQNTDTSLTKPDPSKKILIVEASCGQCQFGLPGKGCDLAIRMDGQAYYVIGTNIDSHGDAHAKDGFCATIRTAEVQGELVGNQFKVTYFKLQKNLIEEKSKK